MLDVKQFHLLIVRPTLNTLGLNSKAAEQLILGTALQESRLTYLKQVGKGPAVGLYQMEPATHDDLWKNFMPSKPGLAKALAAYGQGMSASSMAGDLYYATAMCRIHYLRAKAALPNADDIEGQAKYWKKYYNTELGAGKVEDYMKNKELILTTVKG